MSKLLTIITPTHDRIDLLSRNMKSIRDQPGFETIQSIVVSDSPSDEIYKSFKDHSKPGDIFIYQTNRQGPAISRNIGLQLSDSPFTLFLDDDDYLVPECWKNLATELSLAPITSEGLQVNCILDYPKENPRFRLLDISNTPEQRAFVKNHIPNCAVIYPTEKIKNIRFNPDIAYEDWDFLLEFLKHNNLRRLSIAATAIHKDMSDGQKNRGRLNRQPDLLAATYSYIYSRHPAPNQILTDERIQFLNQFRT
jgi:glycosyltransferase involved in cell wall biosynthesis